MTSPMRSRIRTFLILTGLFSIVTLFFTTSNFFIFYIAPSNIGLLCGRISFSTPSGGCLGSSALRSRSGSRADSPIRGRGWPAHLAVLIPGGLSPLLPGIVDLHRILCPARPAARGSPSGGGGLSQRFWGTNLNYLHNNIVTFLVILVVVWGLDHLRMYRERELAAGRLEAELAQANLQVLKNQVHPHFLFNTLNMISAMVYEDPGKADRMISRLSDLLRATLEQPDAPTVPLKSELEMLTLYLDIMKARFGDRLAVAYDIAPETLPALIPSFVLQPLVENAIRHGIMPRDDGRNDHDRGEPGRRAARRPASRTTGWV